MQLRFELKTPDIFVQFFRFFSVFEVFSPMTKINELHVSYGKFKAVSFFISMLK